MVRLERSGEPQRRDGEGVDGKKDRLSNEEVRWSMLWR